jgi:hypothetical protein
MWPNLEISSTSVTYVLILHCSQCLNFSQVFSSEILDKKFCMLSLFLPCEQNKLWSRQVCISFHSPISSRLRYFLQLFVQKSIGWFSASFPKPCLPVPSAHLKRLNNTDSWNLLSVDTVTWGLKARVARQQLSKEVPAATKMQATIKILLGYNGGNGVFYWVHPKAI